jgi:hypothetical protein
VKRFRTFIVLLLLVLAPGAVAPSPAAAQQPAASGSAQQEGFVPVQNPSGKEQLPAAPLVMIAYAVAWGAVFIYIWSVWQRLGRVAPARRRMLLPRS